MLSFLEIIFAIIDFFVYKVIPIYIFVGTAFLFIIRFTDPEFAQEKSLIPFLSNFNALVIAIVFLILLSLRWISSGEKIKQSYRDLFSDDNTGEDDEDDAKDDVRDDNEEIRKSK